MDLVSRDIVRVIDMIVVTEDLDGTVTHEEMRGRCNAVLAVRYPLKAEINGMIQVEDIEMIGEKLENNCTAALLMFENLWAINFVKAVENANGRSVMHVRIPHEVVVETIEKLANEEAALEAGAPVGSGRYSRKRLALKKEKRST